MYCALQLISLQLDFPTQFLYASLVFGIVHTPYLQAAIQPVFMKKILELEKVVYFAL